MQFVMNNYIWQVVTVPADSPYLVDRTNTLTVATTDPDTLCIYLSNELTGDFKKRVIAHEIGHAACFSFGLLDEIHSYSRPGKQIQLEEFICNFVADYSEMIFDITYKALGDKALWEIPYIIERLVA